MDISVVTVAYGAGPSLGRLLDSLAGEADEVVVVDNGEGGEEIAEAGTREGVRVVSPGENLGFAAGSNLGADEAGGDVLVFLNPDTVVAPGALDSLRRTLEDRSIGIAMARLLVTDDAVSVTTAWTPPTSLARRLWISPVRVTVNQRSGIRWRWV